MTDASASAAPCIRIIWIKDNFVFGDIFHFSEYSKVQLGGWRGMWTDPYLGVGHGLGHEVGQKTKLNICVKIEK